MYGPSYAVSGQLLQILAAVLALRCLSIGIATVFDRRWLATPTGVGATGDRPVQHRGQCVGGRAMGALRRGMGLRGDGAASLVGLQRLVGALVATSDGAGGRLMKILLINVHSDANAGDAVLNETAAHLLREKFPGATITYAMNDPASHTSGTARVVASFMYWCKHPDPGVVAWRWHVGVWALLHALCFVVAYQILGRKRPLLPLPWGSVAPSVRRSGFNR